MDNLKDVVLEDPAERFLRDWLSEGPGWVEEALKHGRRNGFSAKVLHQAAKRLGLVFEPVEGLGGVGAWVWRFPEQEPVKVG